MISVAKPAQLTCLAVESDSTRAPADSSNIAVLTRRLQSGDEESYREFYDLYSNRLYAYLFVVCRGNEEQARELLQQTLIKVARYVRVFDDEDIFWKWLTNLARSAWIDDGRKRNRYLAAMERLWNWSWRERAHEPAEIDLFELLPAEDQLLLNKKYVEGLSIRELAKSLQISEKAVESRLTRARHKMKEIILARRKE
jgi:RNA polymerase sigma-70 factor (ECF subfamily)